MRRALAVLLLVGSSVCVLAEAASHAQGQVIKDPADVRPGMADKDVLEALQICCSARREGPTGVWGAIGRDRQFWTVYLNNGVVVEITHEARTVEPLSAFDMLQIVTNDLVQHCPPASPPVFATRGPGKIDASAHQVSSPDPTPTNPDQVRWMSSIHFSCGNHSLSVGQVPDGRPVITISDAIPNPSRRLQDSLQPKN
jgi:hypothetical protein